MNAKTQHKHLCVKTFFDENVGGNDSGSEYIQFHSK